MVEHSSKGTGAGGRCGEGGEPDLVGRTVARDDANEVEVDAEEAPPLIFPVPEEEAVALVRSFLVFSSAFGVEASEVVAVLSVRGGGRTALPPPGRILPGRGREETRLAAPGGTGGLWRCIGGTCGEPGRTAWIMGCE